MNTTPNMLQTRGKRAAMAYLPAFFGRGAHKKTVRNADGCETVVAVRYRSRCGSILDRLVTNENPMFFLFEKSLSFRTLPLFDGNC